MLACSKVPPITCETSRRNSLAVVAQRKACEVDLANINCRGDRTTVDLAGRNKLIRGGSFMGNIFCPRFAATAGIHLVPRPHGGSPWGLCCPCLQQLLGVSCCRDVLYMSPPAFREINTERTPPPRPWQENYHPPTSPVWGTPPRHGTHMQKPTTLSHRSPSVECSVCRPPLFPQV